MLLLAALIVAGAVLGAGFLIAGELRTARVERTRARALQIMALLAPGLAASADDPRALLVWQPLAVATRKAFPEELALLDTSAGATFPFSDDQLNAAHARWTASWLAWEHAHDSEFKLKAAQAEADLVASGQAPLMRAKLDAVEREKLESYQRRYEEYIRAAKALQNLIQTK